MASKIEKLVDDIINSTDCLTILELCDQYMKDEGCQIVCDKIATIDTIDTIDFRGNDIQESGTQAIAHLIENNNNIKTLKLEWNLIGSRHSLSILCQGLLLSNICHLDLRNNKIDGSGGKILSDMLMKNKILYHLDLRWNNLGLNGGECILQTLLIDNDNYTLTECLLSGNQIPVQILRSIDDALNNNKQQKLTANQQSQLSRKSSSQIDTMSELEIELDSVRQTRNEMNMTLNTRDDTVESLQQEINELFANKSSLKQENEDMKLKIADLESDNLDLKDKCEILENEKNILEKDIYDLNKKCEENINELKIKIKELEIKNEEMHKCRHSDKLEFDNIRESISNNHNVEVNQLRETKDFELNKLRQSMNDLHLEINELKTKNNNLRSEILENEIVSERKYIEFEANLRNECNKTLSDKISDLEKNIISIKKSRDDLEFEMKEEKEKYSKLIEKIETEKNQYQEWLNDEQKNKLKLETEKRNLTVNIQKYTNVITQKNQQIESLKIGLKETEKSIKSLEDEHQKSMKRVLSQHQRQILTLEKSLRETEKRLTISKHRKRNLELRLIKIEDEEQRKIAAVHDAVRCLTNSFLINTNFLYSNKENDDNFIEIKENNQAITKKPKKSKNNKNNNNNNNYDDDDDDDETIIEIVDDDDDDEEDYMQDHHTFNKRKKKKRKKRNYQIISMIDILCVMYD